MPSGPHLLVSLSPHGYGHTAQTAPVVNRLRQLLPAVRVTLRTTVPEAILRARFDPPWGLEREASDFGMVMASAIDVLAEASAAAYREFHRDWEDKIDAEAVRLRALAPDLVLSNVAYLPLAGAARAGLPAVALCSLNWADIHHHYCHAFPGAAAIDAEIRAAYRSARAFLKAEPGMPMAWLDRRVDVGPVARLGRDRRAELDARLGLTPGERLVLVAPGGIPMRIDMSAWPRLPGVRWLVESAWHSTHPDAIALQSLDMHFTDLLRSCDALIGKPGYGSFAEAACNGTPVLYVARGDWPEEPYLVDWLHRHGRCAEIERALLVSGDLEEPLNRLFAQPRPAPVAPTGIDTATSFLAPWLAGGEP